MHGMDDAGVAEHDQAFLDATAVCSTLLRADATNRRWTADSALPKMSVGALACHLSRQVSRAAELLAVPSTLPTLASVDEHYARAAWVTSASPDDPANDRTTDDAEAAGGYARMVERFDRDLTVATRRLRDSPPATVDIPWQGWSLRRNDFLHTRMVEIVVHSTDLAVSLKTSSPRFPDSAFIPVLNLLTRLSIRRHGQEALVSTLTRRERSQDISAF